MTGWVSTDDYQAVTVRLVVWNDIQGWQFSLHLKDVEGRTVMQRFTLDGIDQHTLEETLYLAKPPPFPQETP